MKPYSFLLQKIIFPVSTLVMGRNFWRFYKTLSKSQYSSREQLEKKQLSDLKKLMEHAYANVLLYKEKWGKAGVTPDDLHTLSDLQKFPIITKKDFREGFPQRCTAQNIPSKKWMY